jgi:hypothetical protein
MNKLHVIPEDCQTGWKRTLGRGGWERAGRGEARRTGCVVWSGPLVVYLPSDDRWDPSTEWRRPAAGPVKVAVAMPNSGRGGRRRAAPAGRGDAGSAAGP